MEFGVLGPLEVREGGTPVDIRRGIPRVVLTSLVLRVGEPVSGGWLADVVWGDDAPANPANALQTHVAYLRRALAQASGGRAVQPIATRASGYVLDVPPEHVDTMRFLRGVDGASRQAEAGTATALTTAAGAIEEALALWRGEPFVDVGDRPFVVGEATRLVEARLAAVERRLDCLLALGRHQEAVAELGPLITDHPLRERFYEQLMVGLYRAGRQAEALRAYEGARTLLLDELGLDPGPALQRLARLTLEQAPELDWSPPPQTIALTGRPAEPPPAVAVAGDPAVRRRVGLPHAPWPLIGREEEISSVLRALGAARLVTLTGPGGVGKTSVAAGLGRAVAEEHDVWFVDLGGVHEEGLVPLALATAVGAATQPGLDPVAAAAAVIGGSHGVLIVDTCEHVLGGIAPAVAGILAATPSVRVLATSRRPLGVRGEHLWPVPPLAVPPRAAPAAVAAAAPAVVLFSERGAAARPGFAVTDGNAADVIAVCRALDGLPLAIELAAAHVDTLSPAAIHARLVDRFGLLVDGNRDASQRQRTLRSTIEWSFNLLSAEERRLFIRLSVFAGPFGLDDAVGVAGGDLPDPVRLLIGLVRQSMVAVAVEDRYELLDTLRHYGRELLAGEPDAEEVHERHARLHVDLAALAADGIWSTQQAAWIERLREALPNLRAAIEWSLAHGREELAARITGALSWFFMLEGMFSEGLTTLDRVGAVADRLSRSARGRVAYGMGLLSAPLGRLGEARAYCEASLSLARDGGDARSTADALAALSVTEWALGDLAAAAAHQDEAVELYDRSGDPWRRADILVLRARTALDQRERTARALLEQALALARSVGDRHAGGMALAQLAHAALEEGDPAGAAHFAAEALSAHEALGEPEATAAALHLLGVACRLGGDLGGARSHHARALALASSIGHAGAICEAIEDFAAIAVDDGDHERALHLLEVADRERRGRSVPRRRIEEDRVVRLRRGLEGRAGRGTATDALAGAGDVADVAARLLDEVRARPASHRG